MRVFLQPRDYTGSRETWRGGSLREGENKHQTDVFSHINLLLTYKWRPCVKGNCKGTSAYSIITTNILFCKFQSKSDVILVPYRAKPYVTRFHCASHIPSWIEALNVCVPFPLLTFFFFKLKSVLNLVESGQVLNLIFSR